MAKKNCNSVKLEHTWYISCFDYRGFKNVIEGFKNVTCFFPIVLFIFVSMCNSWLPYSDLWLVIIILCPKIIFGHFLVASRSRRLYILLSSFFLSSSSSYYYLQNSCYFSVRKFLLISLGIISAQVSRECAQTCRYAQEWANEVRIGLMNLKMAR